MKKNILVIILILITIIATGCENKIYYYEKEDKQISGGKISNPNSQEINDNENTSQLEEEPFYKVFDEDIDLDTNKKSGIYIGRGVDSEGNTYIKIKATSEDKELWSYQTPSHYGISNIDMYYSYYSPYYGYDYSYYELHEYYHFYIKENNVIKLFNIKTGEVIWTSDELEIVPTGIIETQDHLYVLNEEEPYVYIIDINNGKLVNKINIKIDRKGFYYILSIIHNKLIIQTHYEAPIVEEIDLGPYSNIYTEYVRVSQSYFDI